MAHTPQKANELFGERVTAITAAPSDPNVRTVRIGRRVAARLRVADADVLEVRIGMIWTQAIASKVEHAQAMDRARRAALRLLGARERSKDDLRQRLTDKGHAEEIIERILDELEHDGWLNEPRFAASLARSILARGPASREALLERLQARQVNAREADRAVEEALAGRDVVTEALAWARKRLSRAHPPDEAAVARIARNLARRGLDEDTVHEVLRELKKSASGKA